MPAQKFRFFLDFFSIPNQGLCRNTSIFPNTHRKPHFAQNCWKVSKLAKIRIKLKHFPKNFKINSRHPLHAMIFHDAMPDPLDRPEKGSLRLP